MKTIKCILSVVIGAGLGLISACCAHRAGPTSSGTHSVTGSQTNLSSGPSTNALPPKQENLPVRKPTLE